MEIQRLIRFILYFFNILNFYTFEAFDFPSLDERINPNVLFCRDLVAAPAAEEEFVLIFVEEEGGFIPEFDLNGLEVGGFIFEEELGDFIVEGGLIWEELLLLFFAIVVGLLTLAELLFAVDFLETVLLCGCVGLGTFGILTDFVRPVALGYFNPDLVGPGPLIILDLLGGVGKCGFLVNLEGISLSWFVFEKFTFLVEAAAVWLALLALLLLLLLP